MPRTTDLSWEKRAAHYLNYDWHLIPLETRAPDGTCSCGLPACSQPGQHPRFRDWRSECSDHESTILSWGDIWEEANIGVVTGRKSDLVVLEVEEERGGVDTLEELESTHEPLTRTVYSSEDGTVYRHFFRHPGVSVPMAIELGPGLRLYGDLQYVPLPNVLWGRVRKNHPHRWEEPPGLTEFAHLPDWLLEAAGVRRQADDPFARGPRPSTHEKSSLPFRSAADLPIRDWLSSPWISKPWLAEGALSLVLGAPKSAGTTKFLLHMVQAILSGTQFLNNSCTQTEVVYLTEQNPPSFAQALSDAGLAQSPHGNQLSVLFIEQLTNRSWGQLIRECEKKCAYGGAKVLIIDSINSFAGRDDAISKMESPKVVEPLRAVLRQGISVCGVYRPTDGQAYSIEERVLRMDQLGRGADVVMKLRKEGQGPEAIRKIECVSSFDETPEAMSIKRVNGQYRQISRFPLFNGANERQNDPPPLSTSDGAPPDSEGVLSLHPKGDVA